MPMGSSPHEMSSGNRKGPPSSTRVELRAVTEADLPLFYEHQLDPEAGRMAAFTARDHEAFTAHWHKIMHDDQAAPRTIEVEGEVAGNIVSWEQDGAREVGYWIDKAFWGRGVATRALALFLDEFPERPLRAHVAEHNVGSIRVLERCGFTISGRQSIDVDEVVLTLT